MNNFYTLHSLVNELIYKISGKEITEVRSSRKDQIDLFFFPEDTGKLTFCTSPRNTALFLDRRIDKTSRNTASFFQEIYGQKVASLEMVSPGDRLIRLSLRNTSHKLLFKPFGSKPNLFLVNNGVILTAFKDHTQWIDKPAPQAEPPPAETKKIRFDTLRVPSAEPQNSAGKKENAKGFSGDYSHENPSPHSLKERVIAIDKQFPRGLINELADTCRLESYNMTELEQKIIALQQELLHPKQVSITAEGTLCLLPPSYLSQPPERMFDSVNDAVRTLFLTRNRESRLLPRKNDLVKKLRKRLRRLEKQQEQLEKEPERLKQADTFEHFGHLLMSQPDPESPVAKENVTVSDWADQGREMTIPVKKGKNLIDQAESYYKKAAGIRREIAVSEKKKKRVRAEQTEIDNLLGELSKIEHPPELDKWLKRHQSRLQQLGVTPSDRQPAARPYRLVPLDNYEVWIGKSAKSNDEMLRLSHKEDIWMHARGTTGSHVILRNRGIIDWPDRSLVLRAASWAAACSRLSGSSMVPVMIAKRKHVRKPKGAPPGQVMVTNERVEMVRPQKPELPDS